MQRPCHLAFASLGGLGSIQGPDCYSVSLKESPLHMRICVVGSAPESHFPFPAGSGTGEVIQKNQYKGPRPTLKISLKFRGSYLWGPIPSQNGPALQGAISEIPEQRCLILRLVHRTTPGCSLVTRVLCPVFSSSVGSSKLQPKAEVANAL